MFYTFPKFFNWFWISTLQTVQFQAKVSPGTHPNGQLRGDVTRPSSRVLWVEVGLGAAQEGRFEDVSTSTVGKEAALVQVHLLPWSLEVQCHCTAAQGEWSVVPKFAQLNVVHPKCHLAGTNGAIFARADGATFRNKSPQFSIIRTFLARVCFCVRACVCFEALTHLAASVPHFLRIIVGWIEALARGVDPAQLSAVVSHKQLSCKMKRQAATCHNTPGADHIYSGRSLTKQNRNKYINRTKLS